MTEAAHVQQYGCSEDLVRARAWARVRVWVRVWVRVTVGVGVRVRVRSVALDRGGEPYDGVEEHEDDADDGSERSLHGLERGRLSKEGSTYYLPLC